MLYICSRLAFCTCRGTWDHQHELSRHEHRQLMTLLNLSMLSCLLSFSFLCLILGGSILGDTFDFETIWCLYIWYLLGPLYTSSFGISDILMSMSFWLLPCPITTSFSSSLLILPYVARHFTLDFLLFLGQVDLTLWLSSLLAFRLRRR
jgi:hypothetical protein